MPATQDSILGLLRVLADETRLRILVLLGQAELSVGEIARCLAMGQSRVSNHLKVLREVGLLGERHEGSYTFCRLQLPAGTLGDLWKALQPSLDQLEHRDADQARLATVLAERADSRAFFERIAGDWDVIGADFQPGTGRLEALTCLLPAGLVVADVGCGTGYLSAAAARRVARVIAIDRSPAMLEGARRKLADQGAVVDLRLGEVEALPLEDGEVDAAFAHMVLHHLPDLRPALEELVRVVRPGGQVVCIDLLPHHETWMHEVMADVRLGLDPAGLEAELQAAGLREVRREMLGDHYVVERPGGRRIPLPLFLVQGRRPAPDTLPAAAHDGGP